MPELPEVERGRKIAEMTAVGHCVARARCADDNIVFCDQSPRTISRNLKGKTVTKAARYGKQLWLEFDQGPALLLHFGMTGSLHGYTSTKERPRFWKIELEFSSGHRLAMPDPRRFGRIRMRKDPRNEPPISLLGFDPLLNMPTISQFSKLVAKRTVTIKGLLLNQKFAAGVGNWIADEILYQANVNPHRKANELTPQEAQDIRKAMRSIITTAVKADSVSSRFPKSWLFHHRWGKPENANTSRGERIHIETIAGRTTAWVPKVQK